MRSVTVWLAAAITAALVFPAAADPVSITKIQARRLPAQAVTRKVMDQLSGILKLEQYPASNVPPRHPLTDLWFWTVPRSTSIPGLCVADDVTVYFKAAGSPEKDAHSAMTAAGISARANYRFLPGSLPPPVSAPELNAVERHTADGRCAKLHPQARDFFAASDENTAAEGYGLLQAILQEARDEEPLKFDCQFYEKTPESCRAALASVQLDSLSSLGRCGGAPPAGNADCVEADLQSWDVRITFRRGAGAREVQSVILAETVTIADFRED